MATLQRIFTSAISLLCFAISVPALAAGFVDVDIARNAKIPYLSVWSSEKDLMPAKRLQNGMKPPSRIYVRINQIAVRAEKYCKANGFDYSTASKIEDMKDGPQVAIVDDTLVPQNLPAAITKSDTQSFQDPNSKKLQDQQVKVRLPHSSFKSLICHGYVEDPKPQPDPYSYSDQGGSANDRGSSAGSAR